MGTIEGCYFSAAGVIHCDMLTDILGPSCEISMASLDVSGSRRVISSFPTLGMAPFSGGPVRQARGSANVEPTELGAADLAVLLTAATGIPADRAADQALLQDIALWKAFRIRFDCGIEDVIALRTVDDAAAMAEYLRRLWPGLRRLCTEKLAGAVSDLSDDAMLWTISQKVNASILIMDEHCQLLKANAAGQDLLADGKLLRSTARGLVCADHKETRTLRTAVKSCFAQENPRDFEYLLILRGRARNDHVPMSLSAYVQQESGTRLVMAMLPMPPDHDRIEVMARRMGLSPSEARVAALIREGHSNREAAEIAGLKIETFNTYAKRALSKMNVKCRAEMAQKLTWQASLERTQ